ncbi:zinc finger protein ZXDC, partial [Aphelenchoides avenae]
DEENKIRVACPYCEDKEFRGWAQNICTHFVGHLRIEDRPYRCSQNGCYQTSTQVSDMRAHFKSQHKKQTWNDEMAKLSEVGPNKERLNAIKRLVEESTGRFKEKTFEELEEQAKTCTLERDAEGILRMKCSVCTEQIKAYKRSCIRYHLMSHLGHSSLPLRCSEDECPYTASRLEHLRLHLRISHDEKELTKEMEKNCELIDNKKRLDAIVAAIYARRPRKDS